MFKAQPNGPFNALAEFVGDERALEIAKGGKQCVVSAGVEAALRSGGDAGKSHLDSDIMGILEDVE